MPKKMEKLEKMDHKRRKIRKKTKKQWEEETKSSKRFINLFIRILSTHILSLLHDK